jgi:hypothetical protein
MQQFDELRQNDRDVHDRVTDARKWLWAGGHRWPLVNASDIAFGENRSHSSFEQRAGEARRIKATK